MGIEQDLASLKRLIAMKREELVRAEARLEEIKKRLKEQWGVEKLEDAEKQLKRLKTRKAKLEAALQGLVDTITEQLEKYDA